MVFAAVDLAHPLIAVPSAIAAALVAYGVIWRKGIIPFNRFMKNLNKVASDWPVLLGIAEEFHPNDGTSLRDAFNRMEHKLDNLDIRINETDERVDRAISQSIDSRNAFKREIQAKLQEVNETLISHDALVDRALPLLEQAEQRDQRRDDDAAGDTQHED